MFEENILEGGFTDFEDDLIDDGENSPSIRSLTEEDDDGVDFENFDDEEVDW